MIRDGFETPRAVWSQEANDATITLQAHDRSTARRTRGRASEHFTFNAGVGSGFYFSYPLPKVPVSDGREGEALRPGQPRGGATVRSGGVAGRYRPGDESAVVPARAGDDLRQRRPLAEAGGARPAAVPGATGAGAPGLDPPTGEPGGGVPRTTRREPLRRVRRERGLPRRTDASARSPPRSPTRNRPRAAEPAAAAPDRADGPDRAATLAPGPASTATGSSGGPRTGCITTGCSRPSRPPGRTSPRCGTPAFDVLIDDLTRRPQRFRDAVRRGFLLMPKVGEDGRRSTPRRSSRPRRSFPGRDAVASLEPGRAPRRLRRPKARKNELDATRATVTRDARPARGISRMTTGVGG